MYALDQRCHRWCATGHRTVAKLPSQRHVLIFSGAGNYVQILSKTPLLDKKYQNEKLSLRAKYGSGYYGSYGFEDDDEG